MDDETLFQYVVERFETETWFALGKIANPSTGRPERSLELAKLTIDVLAMLERKTEGRLSESESRRLRGAITTLRMNYVEEVSKPEPAPAESEESAPPPEGESAPPS